MNPSSHIRTNESSSSVLETKIDRLASQLNKIENERVVSLQREVAILRQLLDFQNAKLDKVTSLLTGFVAQLMNRKGKVLDEDEVDSELIPQGDSSEAEDDDESVLRSIRAFQESVNVSDLQRPNMQQQINHHMNHLHPQPNSTHQILIDQNRASLQRIQQQQQQQSAHHQAQGTTSGQVGRTADNNMDPELHHVSAVVTDQRESRSTRHAGRHQRQHTRTSQQAHQDSPAKTKKRGQKRKRGGQGDDVNQLLDEEPVPSKVPTQDANSGKKIHVEFIHNPTTVREIYDEFYKGYKGQEPLCQMDAIYGKNNWRGDSRSKESKRFQRRKRLCDAIKRGSYKYNKSDDEMIDYLESYRKEKSLTWIMNGHIPADLLE
ncbi:hypothetical protein CANMA_001543 [Candida margitis]|uniref:uncharacterized protein n=1 Tax=Candida margitis TaxID=1775924 RepID=UPI002226082B|nr:uncharacterized protein CANMA_001543 [Candida margitis]KAI5969475.1 hypothetical protein CANMA_001543 [Candida margitis]